MEVGMNLGVKLYKRMAGLCFAVCAFGMSTFAHAEYITYTFSGKLTHIASSPLALPELPPSFVGFPDAVGEVLSGYITVSNTGTDANADPNRGQYLGPAVVPLFYVNLFGETFSYDYRAIRPGSSTVATVHNVDTPPAIGLPNNFIDIRAFLSPGTLSGPISSRYRTTLLAVFNTFDTGLITSDALPNDLSTYGPWHVGLGFFDPISGLNVSYGSDLRFERYVPVPEPTTLALLFVGILTAASTSKKLKRILDRIDLTRYRFNVRLSRFGFSMPNSDMRLSKSFSNI